MSFLDDSRVLGEVARLALRPGEVYTLRVHSRNKVVTRRKMEYITATWLGIVFHQHTKTGGWREHVYSPGEIETAQEGSK